MGVARADAAGLGEMVRAVEAEGGRAAVEATLARFGRVDILVNNAAIRGEVAFEDMTLAQSHQVRGIVQALDALVRE